MTTVLPEERFLFRPVTNAPGFYRTVARFGCGASSALYAVFINYYFHLLEPCNPKVSDRSNRSNRRSRPSVHALESDYCFHCNASDVILCFRYRDIVDLGPEFAAQLKKELLASITPIGAPQRVCVNAPAHVTGSITLESDSGYDE